MLPTMTTSRRRLPADPCTIVTWNANGLAPRAKSSANLDEFRRLLRITGGRSAQQDTPSASPVPDLVLIQEARLKRSSPSSPDQPSPSELREVDPFLSICRPYGYAPIWSLAVGRNAGTLSLVRTPTGLGAAEQANWTAFTLAGALTLMMTAYGLDRDAELIKRVQEFAASSSSAGPPHGSPTKQQSSMMAFVKKPKSAPSVGLPPPTKHDAEGRIQFLRFAGMDVLHTYVPNNGRTVDSNARRRRFDGAVRQFLSLRQHILVTAGDVARPILWAGDLNVARTHLDGTHHSVHPETGAVSEYWTDETKCYSRKDVANADPNRPKGDVGIPGFTPNERLRFEKTLRDVGLVDVWRKLHPHGVQTAKVPYLGRKGGTAEADKWNRANYTWRGTQGRNQAMARYQGKGQRIDYFLISDDCGAGNGMNRVISCDILGYGEAREGFFCGSDHCPVVLVLKNDVGDGGKKKQSSVNEEQETDYNTDDEEAGCEDRKMPAAKKAKVGDGVPAGKEVIDLT